jgi:glycerol-3-phosphate dehydrogenase subunit C
LKIDPTPKGAPALEPRDSRFWDARDLEGELRRVFEICHNCRMCVNYCGSFPEMFARVDRDIEKGAIGAERLGAADFEAIGELCWQCKICYIKCPYTEDEGHPWLVDIPGMLGREKAQRTQRNGLSIQDRALGEPGKLGSMNAGPQARMVNLVNANRLVRKVMEKTAGISADFPLPPFATTPFEKWLEHHEPLEGAGSAGTVAIFSTCTGDFNLPQGPAAAVRVLEKNGWSVVRPKQVCCGIPNLDGGDIHSATAKAKANVESLLAEIEKGHAVVIPSPSCAYTIKKDYPRLLGTPEAQKVAASVLDVMEFLEKLRREKKLSTDFEKPLGKIAYHAACHLRAQKIGTPGARVLGTIPDTEVEIIEQCSAVDGTWGMKAQHYAMGRKYAQKLVRGVEAAEAEMVVSDCPLAGLRVQKENGVRVRHPAEALAIAYGISIEDL